MNAGPEVASPYALRWIAAAPASWGEEGHRFRVGELDAVWSPVLAGVEPAPHRNLASRPLDRRAQHLAEQAGAVLDGPAVGVVAMVPRPRQEARQQVAVGPVDLDPVEPGVAGSPGGFGELVGDRGDVVAGHLLQHGLGAAAGGHHHPELVGGEIAHHVEGAVPGRDRGHEHVVATLDVDPADLAVVDELDGDLRPVGVDAVGEPAQGLDEAVVGQAELVNRVGPVGVRHRAHLGDDEPDPAAGPRLVVGDDVVVGEAVVADHLHPHGRHDDPVAQLHRADADGGEQMVEHVGNLVGSGPRRRPGSGE